MRTWGVRLLDFVQQDDRERAAAHRLGQLAALLEADVARRSAHQPGNRVLLGVFRHVEAHQGALVIEEFGGERAGQLGLADAGGTGEQERPERNVVLMRGHGCAVTGKTVEAAVMTSIYLQVNARLLQDTLRLDDEIEYLSDGEIENCSQTFLSDFSVQRAWEYFRRRAGADTI